jgi:hypothetical protein
LRRLVAAIIGDERRARQRGRDREDLPPRTAIEVEGLPVDQTITVMYAVRSNGNLRTLDGTQCPGVSLPEVCADCTTEVSSALLVETATALNNGKLSNVTVLKIRAIRITTSSSKSEKPRFLLLIQACIFLL